jgi:hypothetical protein
VRSSPPPAEPAGEAPRRRPREPRRGRGGAVVFLLASAVPAAGALWFLLLPESERSALLEKFPAGAGGRALAAAAALAILLLLARVALPAFHGSSGALGRAAANLGSRRGFLRVLLFPAFALVSLLRFVAQVLFAVDAFLILASGVAFLLLVVRIAKPDFLPGVLPELTR